MSAAIPAVLLATRPAPPKPPITTYEGPTFDYVSGPPPDPAGAKVVLLIVVLLAVLFAAVGCDDVEQPPLALLPAPTWEIKQVSPIGVVAVTEVLAHEVSYPSSGCVYLWRSYNNGGQEKVAVACGQVSVTLKEAR